MKTILKITLSICLVASLFFLASSIKDTALGSTLNLAGTTYNLAGNGITSSATSITLQSLTIPQTSALITDAMLSDTFYITLEPGSKTKQEIVSCTTVTQNAGGTATLSGCSRGLLPFTPYTASSTYAFVHAGGSQVIFSDPPQLFEQYFAKGNSETLTGQNTFSATTTFATTTSASSTITNLFSSKAVFTEATSTYAYISSILQALSAIITTLTTNTLTVNTSASLPATTFTGTPTWNSAPSGGTDLANKDYVDGVAIAGAASGTEVTTGIVRLATKAQASLGTSADAVGNRYVLPASMATSSSDVATTSVVVTNTSGKIDSSFIDLSSYTGAISVATSSLTVGSFPAYQIGKNSQIITTTGTSTFTVPNGITKLYVKIQGAGGGGGSATSDGASDADVGGGGGGGGYSEKIVDVTGTSSIQVFVGSGGATNVSGTWTTFGTNGYYFYANGGSAGSEGSAGSGGTGVGGDINITGGNSNPVHNSFSLANNYNYSSQGGNSILGFGGNYTYIGVSEGTTRNGGNGIGYGAGGGGGASSQSSNTGNGGTGAQGIIIISW